jgi:LuxR family maltose regulon positive regulatory protein
VDPNALVPRPHLVAKLSTRGPVTLVSAPAGSGKTALLRSWAAGERGVAWVSVEPGEHDPQRFWRAVVDELQAAADETVHTFSTTPDFDGDALVRRLLTDLDGLDAPVVLVIDDLHELQSSQAFDQLEYLLARLPSRLSVVLATRHDPRLGLHRLRLAGRLTELRADDLRFSLDETRELVAGIKLSEASVRMLHERTEGWVAGLRLAAIALAGYPDPDRFVREFSGSERTVADYLIAEVLEREPEEVRRLLLRTSVLDRVSGPLADAVTGCEGSERVLQRLETANAFVVPLDVGRSWYRFHRLFADLLRRELRRTAPAEVPELHRKASAWLAAHGLVVDAVAHAQAAGDWPHAVSLLSDNLVTLALDGRMPQVKSLLTGFPAETSITDAELATVFAAVDLARGSLDQAADHLDNAVHLAATVPAVRRARFETLLAGRTIALARYRADLGRALDASRSLDAALKARPAQPVATGIDARALALMHLGAIEAWACLPDDATRHLEEALRLARRGRRPYVRIGALAQLATAALGRSTTRARRLSEEAIELAERHGWQSDPIATQAMAALGAALVWSGRYAEAEPWLDRAKPADPLTGPLWREARGLRLAALGHFDEALAEFRAGGARTHARALQMRIRLGEATDADMPPQDQNVLAAFHLAENHADEAVRVLASDSPDVEHYLLLALAYDRLGDTRQAETAIERALDLAEPGGLLLPFALQPVRPLLERHPRHRTAHAALLTQILDNASQRKEPTDELSDAELRVLRYLPSNLGAPEIAAALYVSANTVKTHMRHIYLKLGAHRRTEAVDRARDLGLLAPG